tara:strand:+ start:646 stop:1458 length:813 start_codon:yes stop_codon:yes gene_type:complete
MYKFYYRNVIFILLSFVFCQNTHPYPPLSLITIPTSGVLPYATYSIEGLLIDNGGIVPRLSIGVTKHLTLGFSWGIHNLIGDQRISFNKDYPEYHFKYRIWNEDLLKPAIVIGFDSQGRGQYRNILNVDTDEQFSRYEQKSFGYYIVASKNYVLMGNLGLHVGINKSLETEDEDEDFNIFFGIDKEINRSISFMLEYDAMLNDNNNEYDYQDITLENISLGNGIGYFNAGLRWFIGENILVELNFNDINRNQKISQTAHREFKILYSKKF